MQTPPRPQAAPKPDDALTQAEKEQKEKRAKEKENYERFLYQQFYSKRNGFTKWEMVSAEAEKARLEAIEKEDEKNGVNQSSLSTGLHKRHFLVPGLYKMTHHDEEKKLTNFYVRLSEEKDGSRSVCPIPFPTTDQAYKKAFGACMDLLGNQGYSSVVIKVGSLGKGSVPGASDLNRIMMNLELAEERGMGATFHPVTEQILAMLEKDARYTEKVQLINAYRTRLERNQAIAEKMIGLDDIPLSRQADDLTSKHLGNEFKDKVDEDAQKTAYQEKVLADCKDDNAKVAAISKELDQLNKRAADCKAAADELKKHLTAQKEFIANPEAMGKVSVAEETRNAIIERELKGKHDPANEPAMVGKIVRNVPKEFQKNFQVGTGHRLYNWLKRKFGREVTESFSARRFDDKHENFAFLAKQYASNKIHQDQLKSAIEKDLKDIEARKEALKAALTDVKTKAEEESTKPPVIPEGVPPEIRQKMQAEIPKQMEAKAAKFQALEAEIEKVNEKIKHKPDAGIDPEEDKKNDKSLETNLKKLQEHIENNKDGLTSLQTTLEKDMEAKKIALDQEKAAMQAPKAP